VRIAAWFLTALLAVLQYPLWFGDGGVFALWKLNREITAQRSVNVDLAMHNRALAAEVEDLKQGLDSIEDRARSELGMLGRDETFFQIVEPNGAPAKQADRNVQERKGGLRLLSTE
jgi:cell division protein FtsB